MAIDVPTTEDQTTTTMAIDVPTTEDQTTTTLAGIDTVRF